MMLFKVFPFSTTEEELISNSRQNVSGPDNLKHQMEMLSFSIARTTAFINKQTDNSKQRTRLRQKIVKDKTQLNSLLEKYNTAISDSGGVPLTIDAVMTGFDPQDVDQSDVIPIRVKSKVVDAFEIHDRWTEEVALLKREMSNFLKFYTNVRIPTLQQEIMKLEDQLKVQVELEPPTPDSLPANPVESNMAVETVKYSCSTNDPVLIQGKVALLKKGLFFCREQVRKAVASFHKVLHGDNANISEELVGDGNESDNNDHVDDDCDGSEDDGEIDGSSTLNLENCEVIVPMRSGNTPGTVYIWDFPHIISQSTYLGRNGSNACSIIALLVAQGVHQVSCDLEPSPTLPVDWISLVCGCIKVGNDIYDRSRASLPQRYLSAAEAAMVAGNHLDVSIGHPLPVRVFDPHRPSTLKHHLLQLCHNQLNSYALFIVNEKTILFIGIRNEKLVLVDSHLHNPNGTIVILGKPPNVDDFLVVVKESLGFDNNTFGNLVHLSF